MFTSSDHIFMTRAMRLAEQGFYSTTPNPRVGCVIAKNGVIVGEGAHLKAGEPHAEVYALRQAGERAIGATAYITLEPCSHHGRTPPCAEAIVKSGVIKVIAAMQDPNPLVSGSGLAYLQSHAVEVASGLMQAQAETLNPGFVSRMVRQSPFVRSKIAASLDGKTALSNGISQWITSPESRKDVHYWRARSCAILTGVGTILSDNPNFTVREVMTERQPLRVIVDSQLRTPLDANILQNGRTLIAFAFDPHNKADKLFELGVELLCIPQSDGKVDLNALLAHLGRNEINELMVEGGEGLNGGLIAKGLIDELLIYYAPKLLGSEAKGMFVLPIITQMQQALDIQITDLRLFGGDIRLLAKLSC